MFKTTHYYKNIMEFLEAEKALLKGVLERVDPMNHIKIAQVQAKLVFITGLKHFLEEGVDKI